MAERILRLPPEQQAAAAKYALDLYGPAEAGSEFDETRDKPALYIEKRLGWQPWTGDDEHPGQRQILNAYVLALRQQHERADFEAGILTAGQLEYWRPGEVIKNRLRIEAGHTVGKTKLASGIVNHFFDHFTPSVGYCFAPSFEQIHDLLFKEIKSDRRGKGLPGRILDLELKRSDDHFIKGRATNNASGQGTERAQGQHGKYLIFVLDEAEGIADFVWQAVDSMTSGGISIVLMLANPRTRTSKFHKAGAWSNVVNFRMSCLHHPNVLEGREVVPGAVKRQYVEEMLEKHAETVTEHDEDNHTFEVAWRAGVIYRPDPEFMFRVLGIAPASISDKNLIPVGRYEAATKREPQPDRPDCLRLGIDCARWGLDVGTGYYRYNGVAARYARFAQQNNIEYYLATKRFCLEMKEKHPAITSLHIRVDAGGGFGGGVDLLEIDDELIKAFPDFRVIEVNFGGKPKDEHAYYDTITELTADVAESLKTLAIKNPPETLMVDLCERECEPRNREGRFVKKLEEKDKFRNRQSPHRSPDDGDGFVLAVALDHLFQDPAPEPRMKVVRRSQEEILGLR
ncbi:MAG TPA: hypothetical protein VFQ92_20100 [Blastocatellia bacterium]|nr:hypothetical protein [Blastocatellia bacterium]